MREETFPSTYINELFEKFELVDDDLLSNLF